MRHRLRKVLLVLIVAVLAIAWLCLLAYKSPEAIQWLRQNVLL